MEKKSKTTVLITGASSGIGYELARVFAEKGVALILVARRETELKSLQQELQSNYAVEVAIIVCDLSANKAAHRIYDEINSLGIRVDYLVNNAGVGEFGFFAGSDWQKNQQMINLNITALTELTWMFIPAMQKAGYGRILNVASTAAFQPGPLMAVYYATKAYVLSLSEALANELKQAGITVTALCPGPTQSEFLKAANMEGVRLIDKRQLPSSRDVAELGYMAMMRGRVVAIHGCLNTFMANANRLLPRQFVAHVVRKVMEKK